MSVGEMGGCAWKDMPLRPMQTEERELWRDTFAEALRAQPVAHVVAIAAKMADDAVRWFKYGPPPKDSAGSVEGHKD